LLLKCLVIVIILLGLIQKIQNQRINRLKEILSIIMKIVPAIKRMEQITFWMMQIILDTLRSQVTFCSSIRFSDRYSIYADILDFLSLFL